MSGGQGFTSAAGSVSGSSTLALSGLAVTGEAGTLVWEARSGQGFTSQSGTVTPAATILLVGLELASQSGVVNPNSNGTVALTGSAASGQQQAIAPSWDQALGGSLFSGATGTAAVDVRPSDIAGQQINVAAGSVSAQGFDSTVNISGVEATFALGSVSGGSSLLNGLASTTASGSASATLTLAIVGLQFASQDGTIAPAQEADDTYVVVSSGSATTAVAVILVGSAFTGALGAVVVSSDADIPLTGAVSNAATGTVLVDEQYLLGGQFAAAALQSVGAPGGAALTGASVDVLAGDLFTTGDRSFQLSGLVTTSEAGITFASSLGFATGQQLVSSLESIGPRSAALTGAATVVAQGLVSPPIFVGGATAAQVAAHTYKPKPPPYNDDDLIGPLEVPDWHPDDEKVYTALAHLVIRGYFSGNRI